MDHLEHARRLYGKRHSHAAVLRPEDRDSLAISIGKLIKTCLLQQGGEASFRHARPFVSVIKDTVASGRFHGDRAALAFSTLEKYLLLLVEQPWKREYWLLKTYGGYYSTKVSAHLDNADRILAQVGYSRQLEGGEGGAAASDHDCLMLDQAPDLDLVLGVALDCQVAALECMSIADYHRQMQCVGLTLVDAMTVMLSGAVSDPLQGSGVSAPGVSNNNHYVVGTKPLFSPTTSTTARKEGPQRILAAGGMGVGLVSNTNTHLVTGVPPTRPHHHHHHHHQPPFLPPQPLSAPTPTLTPAPVSGLPYSSAGADPAHGLGLKVDLPQMRHPVGALLESSSSARPASVASRASYGSACTASSGYASGSVHSASSSAYTSGYNSNPPPPPPHTPAQPPYVYPPDQLDSPLTSAPSPLRPPRHQPPQQQHQHPPANFPFIDEDESCAPFLVEATHEEHLRESLRNLQGQGGGVEKHRGKVVTTVVSDGTGGPPVVYDDWRWFNKEGGPPTAYNPPHQQQHAPDAHDAHHTVGHVGTLPHDPNAYHTQHAPSVYSTQAPNSAYNTQHQQQQQQQHVPNVYNTQTPVVYNTQTHNVYNTQTPTAFNIQTPTAFNIQTPNVYNTHAPNVYNTQAPNAYSAGDVRTLPHAPSAYNSHHSAGDVRTLQHASTMTHRSSGSQPATAVTAMLSKGPTVGPVESRRLQRAQSVDYNPGGVPPVSSPVGAAPGPHSHASHTGAVHSNSSLSSTLLSHNNTSAALNSHNTAPSAHGRSHSHSHHAGGGMTTPHNSSAPSADSHGGPVSGGGGAYPVSSSQSQVYYPPGQDPPPPVVSRSSKTLPVHRPTPTFAPTPTPSSSTPTFAQMAARQSSRGGGDNPNLIARQADGVPPGGHSALLHTDTGVTPFDPEVVHLRGKGRDGGMHHANGRSSSLANPSPSSPSPLHPPPPPEGRQWSRSMEVRSASPRWRCRTCTMENRDRDVICSACAKTRHAPEASFPRAGESKLMCPSCTFENSAHNKDCQICHGPLSQDVHTYV